MGTTMPKTLIPFNKYYLQVPNERAVHVSTLVTLNIWRIK